MVKLIKDFLYNKRYTIEGVQKIFKDRGIKAILGGEIQKDFFELPEPEEPTEKVEIKEVEVCRLSEKQRNILQDAKKELSLISESLKKLAS